MKIIHLTLGKEESEGGINSVIHSLNQEISGCSGAWINPKTKIDVLKNRVINKLNRSISLPNFPFRIPQLTSLKYELRGNEKLILHIHKPQLWEIGLKLGNKLNAKVILHAHVIDGFTGGCVLEQYCPNLSNACESCPILKKGFKFLASSGYKFRQSLLQKFKPHIIANSHATYTAIKRSKITAQLCNISIIEPSVNDKEFYPLNVDFKLKTIGFVAYSIEDKNKNFDDFYLAFLDLNNHQDVKALVAGNVTEESKLKYSHPNLSFLGPQDKEDLCNFYNQINTLVITSLSESFGLTSVEAQYCGTPVVSYRNGGVPETILENVTGLISQTNSPESLVHAIKKSWPLKFTNEYQIKNHLNKYSSKTINKKYLKLYEDLIC
ncbi:glycosyltransferase [Lentisphaera marina]|uniref:glycosyltransferase n=1 Tax=Lentisphaera marina TaxID=1111041 RepID=UPI00236528A7|nr:glycosyltransferase [Lentisphaera marina]MDD7986896.1 glycosyltransferase [Lentisphaera marina]